MKKHDVTQSASSIKKIKLAVYKEIKQNEKKKTI